MKRFLSLLAPAAFLAALLAAAPALAEDTAAKAEVTKIDVAKVMADVVVGKEDAPVTIIEYASLTCPHCAHFNKSVLPTVEKELIETGKAKLIFRDFSLDAYALKAAQMARCAPRDKFMPLISIIFNNQERWARSSDIDTSLKQLGVLAGMDEGLITTCMASEDLRKAILAGLKEAQDKYSVHETPSFIFLDDKGERMTEFPAFDAATKAANSAH